MGLDETVRARLKVWMAGRNVTKTQMGKAAGHDQPWASRYLDGQLNAGLDELKGMAAHLGQPLSALFDEQPRPDETEVLVRYRGLTDARKTMVREMLKDWAPDEPPERGRRRLR